jgi:digeranylgeranylglycerophospholipid reductase
MTAYKLQSTADSPDVIVIGGGPVGSYAALSLAKTGVKVTVFEDHSAIGLPSHCAGHISIRSLRIMGLYPLPKGIVENFFNSANFYSPAGTKFSLNLSSPVTVALNRALFDQFLAEQAEAAGASFRLNSHVQSLIMQDGSVRGVIVQKDNGDAQAVYAKIVVDAEGISSRFLRQAGLAALKPHGLVYAVEAEVDQARNVEDHAVEVYLGKAYASGFYGWLIPRLDGTAKVGLATNAGNPRELLQRLMTKHPAASKQLVQAKITKIAFHAITLGGPIPKAYSNGFLAVGDVASQVKPTTGGGVIFGLTCANIAAEVASAALAKGDVSSNFLALYQKRCNEALSFDVGVMLKLRRFLDSLSDEKLDDVLRFCTRLGVDKALRDVEEIDFQGRMMLKVLGKPAMLAAAAYFLLLYLSANP